jgi:hypothetical protein
LNTIGAVVGDPVWLGTNGNLVYGLTNKPYAPAHLVFIGVVTRVNANNGEIFITVQNGFELKEIHDVDIITNVPINGDVLGYDGTLWVNKTIAEWLGFTPANASGTTNYVSKFTGANSLGDSQLFDNGTNVGIGTTSPSAKLNLIGDLHLGTYSNLSSVIFENRTGKGVFSILTNGTTNSEGTTITYSWADGGHGPLKFNNSSNEVMRLSSVGNVGIGTSSPTERLEVQNGSSGAKIKVSNSGGGSASLEISSNASSVAQLSFTNQLSLIGGNVGIGTTSPNQKLHVEGLSYFASDIFTINNGGIFFSGNSSYQRGIYSNASGLTLQTLGSPKLTINDGGNVGIGTTSPTAKLHISDTNKVFDGYGNVNVFTSDTATTNIGGSIALGGTNATGGTNPYVFAKIQGIKESSAGNYNGALIFGTTSPSSAVTEKMRITSIGNVGIGTSSPGEKLDVYGVIRGVYTADPGSGAVTGKFLAYSPSAYGLIFRGYNTGAHSIQVQREANDAETFPISLQPNGSNVGIGTIAPNASALLDVDSRTQGFLPPRMDTGQRDNIASPAPGLMIFNLDTEQVDVFTSSGGWRTIAWV